MMKHHLRSQAVFTLIDRFDCVVILDDKQVDTSRLRRDAMSLRTVLPVVMVQPPDAQWSEGVIPAGIEQFTATPTLDASNVHALTAFLAQRGVRRPLLWFSDAGTVDELSAAWPNALRAMHIGSDGGAFDDERPQSHDRADVFIADDDERAAKARLKYGNGISIAVIGASPIEAEAGLPRPVAFSDTGLGVALSPTVLHALVHRLPWWDFHIAGDGERSDEDWEVLRSHPNVLDFGAVDELTFMSLQRRAVAYVLPCSVLDEENATAVAKLEARRSSGVPVIASPAFCTASNVTLASSLDAFADNLRRAWAFANLARLDEASVWLEGLAEAVTTRYRTMLSAPVHGRLNILMLYDDHSTFTTTVREHLESFAAFSRHSFHYMPATSTPIRSSESFDIDLSIFDVVIFHYSVRLAYPDFLQSRIADKIERFHGLKVLFIQDEYDGTEIARNWMERLCFDVVYTCVPPACRAYVYPEHRLPRIEFLSTLTGYVPLDTNIDNYALPIDERTVRIAYRGRMLSYRYGMLGWQKFRIGVDVKRLADERGVSVDIEVDDCKRIYGADWYRFLGSARATLGTESGSNVFDFDGTICSRIEAALAENPEISFENIYKDFLEPLEKQVCMNQISPKIFEAARLRTALILFEGEYSGIIRPYEHYLPLRRDYSNLEEVLAALEDVPRLREITNRTYRDLIASGRYSYEEFIRGVDSDIERRVLRGPSNRIFAAPALLCDTRGNVRRLPSDQAAAWCLFDEVLTPALTRHQASELFEPYVPPVIDMSFKARLRRKLSRAVVTMRAGIAQVPRVPGRLVVRLMRTRIFVAVGRPLWRLLPAGVRRTIVVLLWG